MSDLRTIERIATAALPVDLHAAIVSLCDAAYEEPMAPYFADIGPGEHLVARVDGAMVAHLMWVDRPLYLDDGGVLHAAYIELVATHPGAQRRGHASALLVRAVREVAQSHDIAVLSPSDEAFYARLGWTTWCGALSVRHDGAVEPSPDEVIMVHRLPRTPPSLDLSGALAIDWRPGEVW